MRRHTSPRGCTSTSTDQLTNAEGGADEVSSAPPSAFVQALGQWKESPQAQEPPALGLSMVKPCFSMVSTKSIVAPLR